MKRTLASTLGIQKDPKSSYNKKMRVLIPATLILSLFVILSASLIRFNYVNRSRQLQLSPFVNRGGYIPARQRRKAVRRSTFDVELID